MSRTSEPTDSVTLSRALDWAMARLLQIPGALSVGLPGGPEGEVLSAHLDRALRNAQEPAAPGAPVNTPIEAARALEQQFGTTSWFHSIGIGRQGDSEALFIYVLKDPAKAYEQMGTSFRGFPILIRNIGGLPRAMGDSSLSRFKGA